MKKLLLFLALAAGSIAGWAEQYPEILYAVGDATTYNWPNPPTDAHRLYKISEKLYEGFVNFDTTNGELKFLVTNEYNQGQWGAVTNGTSITSSPIRTEYESVGSGSNEHPDKKFRFNLPLGLYLVTIDLRTSNNETVTFKKWSSANDVYEIGNLAQLKAFADCVNRFDATINGKLTADIGSSEGDKMNFAIGWHDNNNDNGHKWYSGEFDGNYHTVWLAIDDENNDNKGLFAAITNEAYIHDVTVAGSVKGNNYVGGVVASVRGGSSGEVNISNCKNTATITATGTNAGGIVGVNINNNPGYCKTNILYCCNTGNVSGNNDSGLISGWIGNGSIKHTYAIGTISGYNSNREFARYETCDFYANVTMTGSTNTGGAAYYNPADDTYTINNVDEFLCIATMVNVGGRNNKNFNLAADIDASTKEYTPIGTSIYNYIGTFNGQGHYVNLNLSKTEDNIGLIAYAGGGATIQNLVVKGNVSGKAYVGGIIGCAKGSGTLTINRCGNEAAVTASAQNAGGLLGCNLSDNVRVNMTNCYNAGAISGGSESAAISGWLGINPVVTNCYNNGTVTGVDGSGRNFARWNTAEGKRGTYINCYNTLASSSSVSGRTDSYDSQKVTSGELCAKLGYAFRQTLGTGYPCFDETLGFVSQIGDAGYSTMFNKYSDVEIPDGVEAFAGVKNGTEWLRLLSIEENIAKDEPVILRGNAGLYNFMPTTGISRAASNELSGSNGTVSGDGSTIYALAKKGEPAEVGFYLVNNGLKIPEGRAYLKIADETPSGGGDVKGFTFVFEDTEDGIKTLSNSPLKGENIYNLAGQRINKMQKGINIVNGKKIMK